MQRHTRRRRVRGALAHVTGKWLRRTYEELARTNCGCAHVVFDETYGHEVAVVVGATTVIVDDGDGDVIRVGNMMAYTRRTHDECAVAWKIAWQTFNSGMQCDFDVDWDMPWNTPEYCDRENARLKAEGKYSEWNRFVEGDVYDTTETIELKQGRRTPAGYRDWNALAAYIRKTARIVARYAKEVDSGE